MTPRVQDPQSVNADSDPVAKFFFQDPGSVVRITHYYVKSSIIICFILNDAPQFYKKGKMPEKKFLKVAYVYLFSKEPSDVST